MIRIDVMFKLFTVQAAVKTAVRRKRHKKNVIQLERCFRKSANQLLTTN